MTNLYQLQREFQYCLFQSDYTITERISASENFTAVDRFNIYLQAYSARLIEALSENYPVLYTLLGDEDFSVLSLNYLQTFPSNYRSIRWFGDKLADFLSSLKTENYLIEMAKLEWLVTEVFDAKDANILSADKLNTIQSIKWGELSFIMHPSIRRLNCNWNVVDIWSAVTNHESPPPFKWRDMPVAWLFWRKELTEHFNSLSIYEAWMLDAMLSGSSFGLICEGLCTWIAEEQVGRYAASLLKTWIEVGLITDITLMS